MPRTGYFGGFYFDAEVFTDMMQEADYWKNEIMASGIVQNNNAIMGAIGTEGNVATIPMWKPFNVFEDGMQPLNNDGMTDNTPVEITGNKQTAMLIQRMKAWKSKDFTVELTGADPLEHIKNKVAGYYNSVWERELMNIVQAVMQLEALESHVTDLTAVDGTVTAANMVDATTLIDAEQNALGDMAGDMGLIIMHSKVFAQYQKLQLVEYDKFVVGNGVKNEVLLPHIGGKIPYVTDFYTVDASGAIPVYNTYVLGQGAFQSATKNNYENPYYVDYDPEAYAGVEMLYTKQGKVLHPNGLSLAVDNIATESPTFAELGNPANWSLKFNHKNVKMGLIKSNG